MRKCQQSILWKLLNSLSVIGAYTLCLRSLVDQKRHVCPRSGKCRCYRYVQWGSYSLLSSMFPKSLGVFGNVLHAQISVKTFGKQSRTLILLTEAMVRVGCMQRFTIRWNLLIFAKEKKKKKNTQVDSNV